MSSNGHFSARWLHAAVFLVTLGAARQAWASGMSRSEMWGWMILYLTMGAYIGIAPLAALASLIILYRHARGKRTLGLRKWAIGMGITLLGLVAAGAYVLLNTGHSKVGPVRVDSVLGLGVLALADFVVAKRCGDGTDPHRSVPDLRP